MASSTMTSSRRRQSNRALLSVLSQPSGKRPALPHELILKILEYPPSWVLHSRHILSAPVSVSARDKSKVLCCTRPFTARSLKLFGEAVFTFRSHDQGWCSSPGDGNWTWFDVQLENKTPEGDVRSPQEDQGSQQEDMDRPREDVGKQQEERRMLLKMNRQGEKESMSYTHSLDRSKFILCDLRVGDEIQLLGCACFPLWENTVEKAAIEIWGVDTLGDEQDPDEQIPIPEPTSSIPDMTGTRARLRRIFMWKPSRRRHTSYGQ